MSKKRGTCHTLKFFLTGLKNTKGIERNLFAKKFLSNIFYSPESIKIRFISRQSDGSAVAERSPAPPMAGLGERTLSSSKNEFVSSFMAPWVGIEPTTNRLTGDRSTAELPRNNILSNKEYSYCIKKLACCNIILWNYLYIL